MHADVISTPGSACTVRVIPTNEDLMIARHTRTLLVLDGGALAPNNRPRIGGEYDICADTSMNESRN